MTGLQSKLGLPLFGQPATSRANSLGELVADARCLLAYSFGGLRQGSLTAEFVEQVSSGRFETLDVFSRHLGFPVPETRGDRKPVPPTLPTAIGPSSFVESDHEWIVS